MVMKQGESDKLEPVRCDRLDSALAFYRLQTSNFDDAGNLQEELAPFIMELNMYLAPSRS